MDLGLKVTTIFLKKLRTFGAHLFFCTKPRPHGRGYITAGPSGLGQHSKPQYQLCPTVRALSEDAYLMEWLNRAVFAGKYFSHLYTAGNQRRISFLSLYLDKEEKVVS
jgi:hypothetical protein